MGKRGRKRRDFGRENGIENFQILGFWKGGRENLEELENGGKGGTKGCF